MANHGQQPPHPPAPNEWGHQGHYPPAQHALPPLTDGAPFSDHKRRPFARAVMAGQPVVLPPPPLSHPHQPPMAPITPVAAPAVKVAKDARKPTEESGYTLLIWWLALLGHMVVIPGVIAWPLALAERRRREQAAEAPSRKIREALLLCKLLLVMVILLVVMIGAIWMIIEANGGWARYSKVLFG